MNLKKFPDSEKPRERLIKYGAENLSNTDLISILIGTGTKNCNVKELSSIILSKINIGVNLWIKSYLIIHVFLVLVQ